jgi:hypothetical protein
MPRVTFSLSRNALSYEGVGDVLAAQPRGNAARLAIRPYWEKYFELLSVKYAHARKNCRDLNGTEPWACCNCDCTRQLEERLAQKGEAFLERLRSFRREMLRPDPQLSISVKS